MRQQCYLGLGLEVPDLDVVITGCEGTVAMDLIARRSQKRLQTVIVVGPVDIALVREIGRAFWHISKIENNSSICNVMLNF